MFHEINKVVWFDAVKTILLGSVALVLKAVQSIFIERILYYSTKNNKKDMYKNAGILCSILFVA